MEKVVTALLFCGAMVSVVAWIVALLRENGVCPLDAAARFVRGLPLGGRLALLPLFAALVVYGSVKQSSVGVNHGIHGMHGKGSGSVFNAENAESQEAQSGNISDNNVANVEMLPITNTNSQLETGNIGNTGNINFLLSASHDGFAITDFAVEPTCAINSPFATFWPSFTNNLLQ